MFIFIANAGTPPIISFFGEILLLIGIFRKGLLIIIMIL